MAPAPERAAMSPFEKGLRALVGFLERRELPYMVIGGVANLVWGRARSTLDIDLTIWTGEGREAAMAREFASVFRALPPEPVSFVAETKVLPLEAEGIQVDVVFGQLPYERRAIARARPVELAGIAVRVCSPEDLILHKVISERPRDLEDVRGIVAVSGAKLDRGYLDPLVRDFARELAMPAIWTFYESCWR